MHGITSEHQELGTEPFAGVDCFSKIKQHEVEVHVQKSLNLDQLWGLISASAVQLTQIALGNHRHHFHIQ